MIYRKNLPAWERALRTLAGVAMAFAGLLALHGLVGALVVAGGVAMVLMGAFGYCPACALAGRRPVE